VAAVVLVASACLRDLPAFPGPPEPSTSEPTALSACGDGFIESLDDGGDAGESCDPGDASSLGCERCAVTCTGRIDSAGHCYSFVEDTLAYSAAVSACAQIGAHVVTLSSAKEAAFVQEMVTAADGTQQPFWVGLSIRDDRGGYAPPLSLNEPGWPSTSGSCSGCFAMGADDAGAFLSERGEDAGTSSACLVSTKERWLRAPCVGTEARHTLCEREPLGQRTYPCGGLLCMSVPATMGKKRYLLWPSPETAENAASLCAASDPRASLWMLDSREEREQLVREILSRFSLPTEVWIGLSVVNGSWVWADGVPVEQGTRPKPWANTEPSHDGGRAYLRIDENAFDTQLARSEDADAGANTRIFVCQIPASP
jgi:hypothetical protein